MQFIFIEHWTWNCKFVAHFVPIFPFVWFCLLIGCKKFVFGVSIQESIKLTLSYSKHIPTDKDTSCGCIIRNEYRLHPLLVLLEVIDMNNIEHALNFSCDPSFQWKTPHNPWYWCACIYVLVCIFSGYDVSIGYVKCFWANSSPIGILYISCDRWKFALMHLQSQQENQYHRHTIHFLSDCGAAWCERQCLHV